MEEFQRKPIKIDKYGRITIPKPYRKALGLPEGQEYPIWIEPYPDLKNCKRLIIWK